MRRVCIQKPRAFLIPDFDSAFVALRQSAKSFVALFKSIEQKLSEENEEQTVDDLQSSMVPQIATLQDAGDDDLETLALNLKLCMETSYNRFEFISNIYDLTTKTMVLSLKAVPSLSEPGMVALRTPIVINQCCIALGASLHALEDTFVPCTQAIPVFAELCVLAQSLLHFHKHL